MVAWTEDRVTKLRALWATGLSASRIAEKLGGVTRNSVIGKAHRLELASRVKPKHAPTQNSKADPNHSGSCPSTGKCVEANATSNKIASDNLNAVLSDKAKVLPIVPNTVTNSESAYELELEKPLIENAGILQLTDQTCKWPLGDPGSEGFHFCCRRIGTNGPYCDYHARCAYQTVEHRRDRRVAG